MKSFFSHLAQLLTVARQPHSSPAQPWEWFIPHLPQLGYTAQNASWQVSVYLMSRSNLRLVTPSVLICLTGTCAEKDLSKSLSEETHDA